ncbi:uncharacterized protein LOC135216492 [Macrobrachium nipponense]|uniref:uncharacterized protein LOC135216492 n=1 Tax=Macrobrachium nipponense TaxID=159736 RepID=UPI0030C7ABAF
MAAAVLAAVEHDSCVVDEASVRHAAVSDPVYQLLMARVLAGDWADIIPEPLRQQVAANLHAGHQGLDSMQRRVRQTVYWPRLEGDLQYRRSLCEECDVHAPSQAAEELIITPPPHRLAGAGPLPPSSHIKTQLCRYFARWGAPEQISTDGGTNLASEEMGEFFKLWDVSVRLSSAQYPQSNCRAEAAVKVGKRIIMANTGSGGNLDTDKSSLAMLQYLNTPLCGMNKSPAQMVAGRQLRDGVPTARWHLTVDKHRGATLRHRERQMADNGAALTENGPSRTLPVINPGSHV